MPTRGARNSGLRCAPQFLEKKKDKFMQPDMYDDSQSPDNAAPEGAEAEGKQSDEMGETALLPKSILGGKDFQVGNEVVLRIVAEREGQVEVEYAPKEESENPETEAPDKMAEMLN